MSSNFALNPRRIARSLVTVLALTLLQSVAAPIALPEITTPKSQAVSGTFTATSSTSRQFITIPAGVESITLVVTGGGGGRGGDDGIRTGAAGGLAGRVTATFAVTPGDVVTLMPGNAGINGVNASKDTGGFEVAGQVAGGASTVTDNYWKINGTSLQNPNFSGGAGGKVGFSGSSGSGGGGGAASVVAINRTVVAIAAGAGGGGGAGNTSGAEGTIGVDSNSPNSNLFAGGAGKNSGSGQSCTATDGGGGGGGGGGLQGGLGGNSDLVVAECSGRGGYRGSSFVEAAMTSSIISFNTSATPASPSAGTITYSYDVKTPTACVPTSQTVDIYTVLKFDSMINCTWSVPANVSTMDIFAVGGGGGGGSDGGSGGGGGAGLSRTAVPVSSNSNITIKVGVGGRGGIHNSWNADPGESSTVVTTSGSVLYALGGAAGGARTGAGGAGGTAPNNGAFAGGAGGTYPNAIAVGGIGNFGVTNYFYGTQNTYGGGGGGGCYYETGSNVSGAAGRNGGGAGCSNTTNGQVDGINGTNGTGGGGGGGGAGAAGRVLGGKGGSGVVLIRYATAAADAFPAGLAASIAGRWTPNELQVLDSSRKGWLDSSGTYTAGAVTGSPTVTTTGMTDGVNLTGSSKTNLSAAGGTGTKATFVTANIPTYTVFHIARYATGGTQRRIITASNNWLSGHYNSARYKAAYHVNDWMTPVVSADSKWLLSTDQVKMYRANGRDVSFDINSASIYNSTTGPTGLGINAFGLEESDWQFLDLIAFNRNLSAGEIRSMERYLANIYGLTLESDSQNAETDTAASFDSGQYMYTQHSYGERMNDTFTVEAWVKPGGACGLGGSGSCGIFSRENTFLAKIDDGTVWYAMYGTSSAWEWIDTGIKAPINEWHHYTFAKRGVANAADSFDLYLDGQWVWTKSGNPYRAGTVSYSASDVLYDQNNQWSYVGVRADTSDRMVGQIDEVKIWKVARTASQILADIHSNDATSPNLQFYWDFNRSVGTSAFNVPNLAQSGPSRSDLVLVGTHTFTDVKVTTVSGPYTTITFPRSHITQTGGWRVPVNFPTATTIVVGGGGGSGKSASSSSAPGGSGGGGGVTYSPTQAFTAGAFLPVRVGTGGVAATTMANDAANRSGASSYLGVASGLTALGGGGGGSNGFDGAGGSTIATGGGGGGSSLGSSSCSTRGYSGGVVSTGYNGANGGWGWGGLGGSARGAATTTPSDCYGNPGPGFIDSITTKEYGQAGSNQFYATWSSNINYLTTNNGWGGSVAYGSPAPVSGIGTNGSHGVVIIRYITATKPTYTKPNNAYLNVGMTETFTTNVAVDSATVGLTRTFKWESTTPTANGAYTTLKVGTGAANAAYSWVPSDTSTSGSGYLYRLTVTDSDTAGLFITDSSTAFAVINRALVVTSSAASNSLAKKINIARNETFTITLGTPTYRATLTPVIPGITIDTSTAGSVILRIAETATVGTWLETLTVTDSVSASIVIPLTIVVAAPPTLLNTSEIVTNGLIFNLDAGNSASLLLNDSVAANGATWNDLSGRKNNATSGVGVNTGGYSGTSCTAPNYSSDNGGAVVIAANSDNCFYSPFTGREFDKSYTFEAWFKSSATIPNWAAIVSQGYAVTGQPISVTIGSMGASTIFVAFFDGAGWRYANCGFTPTIGVWTHIAGTYDGANMVTYINGSNIVNGSACSTPFSGGLGATINPYGLIIGKGHAGGTGGTTFPGSIASVRLYNVPMTSSQILQNYNATKYRFANSNQTILKASQKYGNLTQESFTATSGHDTKTVTFATGSRAGIKWETVTAMNRVDLSIQESLTVGTYNDTITVTDSLGQSTYLPIRMTVTKADSLTVSMDTATSVSYNGSPITIYPRTTVKGFKSSDTATSLVRFSSSLYSESTVVPTNADTYTVRGAEPVFTIGSLSNYEGVIYETRTAVVRKINQRPLNIFKYGGTVGSGFIIQLQGGDGTGSVTETLTGVSTLTGCAISNRILTAAEQKQGFCEVRVVKAGDQNYFAETETAQLYFMAFVNNQPTGQVGSGSTIALNGATSLETSTVQAPSITGLSTLTLSLGAGGNFTITGTGFTGTVTIKFWRNKSISVTSGDGTTIVIPASSIASAGATSGRIAVITTAGEGVSVNSLTITP